MITTQTKGIFQSDIIIRTAILAAIEDIRKNPYLLDFVFAGLPNDELTAREYGVKELERAKEWFLNTEIPVSMAHNVDSLTVPRIAVSLQESTEATSTLGDVSVEGVTEDLDTVDILKNPNVAFGPFTPTYYDSTTGWVGIPDSIDIDNIFINMYILDRNTNISYIITEIGEDYIVIDKDIVANFTNAYITHVDNLLVASLESLEFKESYRIDLYVSGNSTHLIYLWSIILFALLRYKQAYLEVRGFERSTVNSQGVMVGFPSENSPELIYTRALTLTGFVRQYWPKNITPKLDGINFAAAIINEDNPTSPDSLIDEVASEGIGMEEDSLGF